MISPNKPYTISIIIFALYFILIFKSIKQNKEINTQEDTKEKLIDEIKKIIPYYKANKRFLRKLQNNENKVTIQIKGEIGTSVAIISNGANVAINNKYKFFEQTPPDQIKLNNQIFSSPTETIILQNTSITVEMVWNQPLTCLRMMFFKCKNIESIDFSNFNFSQVNDTSSLMEECSNLKYVNFGNADLSKVENMDSMFYYCISLEKVDNSFKTYNVKNINYLFSGCESLKSIDLSDLYTPFLTYIDSAFSKCPNLTSIELPNLNLSSVDKIEDFFTRSNNIKYINLLNYLPGKDDDGNIITILDSEDIDTNNLIICS